MVQHAINGFSIDAISYGLLVNFITFMWCFRITDTNKHKNVSGNMVYVALYLFNYFAGKNRKDTDTNLNAHICYLVCDKSDAYYRNDDLHGTGQLLHAPKIGSL